MSKTLLLADDSVTIQKVVGISFASEDIRIVTVDNGDAAVAKARELRPDVVLADVVMPGLSGYEVCEALKADPALRHVPVLLLTGTFEAFDEERASRAGAAGHVAKPFEAQTLVERVKELLAAPPVRPAAPAAPPAPAAEGAFDFFGDNEGDPLAADFSAEPAAGGAEPLDFDEADAAFAFGDEDLSPVAQEPVAAPPLRSAGPPLDATVAILPEPAEREESSFDFDLGASPREAEDAGGFGRATLLDPPSRDYDVSSSDLAGELPPPVPPTRVIHAEPDPFDVREPVESATDPFAGADDDEGFAIGEPLEPDADDTGDLARPFGAVADPTPWPRGREETPSALDWPDDEPYPLAERDDDAPPADRAPFEAAPREPASAPAPAASGGSGTALSPALRAELRDTLEKIAWDAFGPITEKIVRQALERIEQVAWEVVPRLAETLIQEEIRRLKDEGADE